MLTLLRLAPNENSLSLEEREIKRERTHTQRSIFVAIYKFIQGSVHHLGNCKVVTTSMCLLCFLRLRIIVGQVNPLLHPDLINLWELFKNNNYNILEKNNLLILFISLECKYNKVQFGISISSIEASKQKLHITTSLCLQQQQKLQQRNPSRSDSFLLSYGIQSVSKHLCL